MDALEAIFRWMHVFAGIIWIGHLYFFNWVNGPLQAKLTARPRKLVVPGIDAARSLLVPLGSGLHMDHRCAASGMLVYYMGQQAFATGAAWSAGTHRHDRRDVPRGLYL